MKKGEVWAGVWLNDPDQKERPLLIVSNNHRNSAKNLEDIIVVKLTSLYREDGSKKITNPSEDIIETFKSETIIRCASIYSIEKKNLKRRLAVLGPNIMSKVNECLKIVLNL